MYMQLRASFTTQCQKGLYVIRRWIHQIIICQLCSGSSLFALQTIEAIVKEVGGDRVGLRLSPYNWDFNQCFEPDAESTIKLNVHLLKELNKFNLAYVHIVTARAAGAVACLACYAHQLHQWQAASLASDILLGKDRVEGGELANVTLSLDALQAIR